MFMANGSQIPIELQKQAIKRDQVGRKQWISSTLPQKKIEPKHIRQSFVQCGPNFSNKLGGNFFDQLNSKLRICLTFDEDWDHEHWIQSQILSKTKAYPYSHLIEPSDFLQPYSEPRKNK